jgi:hypothetical protein
MVEMACSQYLFERLGCYCLFSSAIRGLKASPHDIVGQLATFASSALFEHLCHWKPRPPSFSGDCSC